MLKRFVLSVKFEIQWPRIWACFWIFQFSNILAAASTGDEQFSNSYDLMGALRSEFMHDFPGLIDAAYGLYNSTNCTQREVGYSVLIQLAPERIDSIPIECAKDPSANEFWIFHLLVGNVLFDSSDFEGALEQYWHVEREAGDNAQLLYTNLGASYYQLGQVDYAVVCFEDAFENLASHEPEDKVSLLNNIAAAHSFLRDFENAERWIDAARENERLLHEIAEQKTVNSAFDRYGYDEDYLARVSLQIDINEMFVRIGLQDTSFVRENWSKLPWSGFSVGPLLWFNLAYRIGSFLETPNFFHSQLRNLSSTLDEVMADSLLECDPSSSIFRALLDFKRNNPNDSEGLLNAWQGLTRIYKHTEPRSNVQVSALEARGIGWVKIGFVGLVTVVWIGLALAFIRIQRAKRRITQSVSANLDSLKAWNSGKVRGVEALHALSFLSRCIPTAQLMSLETSEFDFASSEVEVLHSAWKKESPKELARRMGWSPKYTYNLRSSIRKKVGLDPNESLEDWVQKQELWKR